MKVSDLTVDAGQSTFFSDLVADSAEHQQDNQENRGRHKLHTGWLTIGRKIGLCLPVPSRSRLAKLKPIGLKLHSYGFRLFSQYAIAECIA